MADVLQLPKWVEKYYQEYFNRLEAVRFLFKLHYREF